MKILLLITGLTILGIFIRGIAKDKSIANKPKNNGEWITQLVISLIVGFIIWIAIPKSCKESSDYDPTEYQRLSRD